MKSSNNMEIIAYALFDHHKNGTVTYEHYAIGRPLSFVIQEIGVQRLENLVDSNKKLTEDLEVEKLKVYQTQEQAVEMARTIRWSRLPPVQFQGYRPAVDFYRTEICPVYLIRAQNEDEKDKIVIGEPVAAVDSAMGTYNFDEHGHPVLNDAHLAKYERVVAEAAKAKGIN